MNLDSNSDECRCKVESGTGLCEVTQELVGHVHAITGLISLGKSKHQLLIVLPDNGDPHSSF